MSEKGNRENSNPNTHSHAGRRALVIEDMKLSEQELVRHGYDCIRITHDEVTGIAGTQSTSRLLKGDYNML